MLRSTVAECGEGELSWSIAIHGGAGLIRRDGLTEEREAACREGLAEALARGRGVLEAHGSALDAVTEAVRALEECPLFNAGRGAVLAADGGIELDASVMDGETLAAGAVAGARTARSPILAARAVMEHSPHVLLIAEGADRFAAERGLEIVPPSWFETEERRQQFERVRGRDVFHLDHGDEQADVYGTVGAVARDEHGRLAAATSTGGMVNKRPGRVGDSPIIGAGTWADSRCAVSGTGHGEPFIRRGVAARIAARMEFTGATVAEAADQVVLEELPALGGAGGAIAVGRDGTIALPFNTAGMFRASQRAGEPPSIAIWASEGRGKG